MARSRCWVLIPWCLASGLNLFASALPPDQVLTPGNEMRPWKERCKWNRLNPDGLTDSKFQLLDANCNYLGGVKTPPVKLLKDGLISRLLRSGLFREGDSPGEAPSEPGQSGRGWYLTGKIRSLKLLKNDRKFRDSTKEEESRSKISDGVNTSDDETRNSFPAEEDLPVSENPVDQQRSGMVGKSEIPLSVLSKFLDSKRNDARETRDKSAHGGHPPGHPSPRWSVYFIG